MQHRYRLPLMVVALTIVTACGGTDRSAVPTTAAVTTSRAPETTSTVTTSSSTTVPATTTTTEPPPSHAISFETTGWPELAGAHYEGWLIVDESPVSTGRFNVVDGATVDLEGTPLDEFPLDFDPTPATTVVITIEPTGDEDPAPATTHLLAGDIVAGTGRLAIDHPEALGTDFASASGLFVLATPTDGDRVNNEYSGVWFLTFPGPEPGLQLPDPPQGWVYEGWTVIEGIPVTTGTFSRTDRSDDSAPYSGNVRTPNFPGEDYLFNAPEGLTFPTNLQGATVAITIEPVTEDNAAPFGLVPLSGPIPRDAELEPIRYPLTGDRFDPPGGTAILR